MDSDNRSIHNSAVKLNNSQVDDLKRIEGIGPGLEKRLNEIGIFTFDQLAALSEADICSRLGKVVGLTVEKIEKQNWTGQARRLVNEELAATPFSEQIFSGHSPHATFTVELLLNKEHEVRGTTIIHCQTRQEKNWAGWDKERLINFMVGAGELMIQSPISTPTSARMPASKSNDFGGMPTVRKMTAVLPGEEKSYHVLGEEQNFDVDIEIDLTGLNAPANSDIKFDMVVYARQLGNHQRKLLGQSYGTSIKQQMINTRLTNKKLSQGVYRLETALVLSCAGIDMSIQKMEADLQGDLLSIFSMDNQSIVHRN